MANPPTKYGFMDLRVEVNTDEIKEIARNLERNEQKALRNARIHAHDWAENVRKEVRLHTPIYSGRYSSLGVPDQVGVLREAWVVRSQYAREGIAYAYDIYPEGYSRPNTRYKILWQDVVYILIGGRSARPIPARGLRTERRGSGKVVKGQLAWVDNLSYGIVVTPLAGHKGFPPNPFLDKPYQLATTRYADIAIYNVTSELMWAMDLIKTWRKK